jgi:hypothetical protein
MDLTRCRLTGRSNNIVSLAWILGLLVLAFGTSSNAQQVGILKGRQGCPAGMPEVAIIMDNEDNHPASSLSGWVGGSTIDGNRNITLRFCRTGADAFLSAPGRFALLALGTCPPETWSIHRVFDAENHINLSDIEPTRDAGRPTFMTYQNTYMYFCVFQGADSGSFPVFDKEYGVFSDIWNLPNALEFGSAYSDDEDDGDPNYNAYHWSNTFDWYVPAPHPLPDVTCCWRGLLPGNTTFAPQLTYIRGVLDTTLSFARVTATPPPTQPKASCVANPRDGVNELYTEFDGSTSFARNGRVITSYAWTFYGGSTASGPGPHGKFYTVSPELGIARFTARLTVTDNAGETSTTSCTAVVVSDQGCPTPGATGVVSQRVCPTP